MTLNPEFKTIHATKGRVHVANLHPFFTDWPVFIPEVNSNSTAVSTLLDMLLHAGNNQEQVSRTNTTVQNSSTTESIFSPGLKHARQRSSSWGATFYSSTVVPASPQNEALSSLITSLTSISDAKRLDLEGPRPRTAHTTVAENGISAISVNAASQRDDLSETVLNRPVSDQDYCPPPVAGYNTINADKVTSRPKTSAGPKAPRRFKDKNSQQKLQASTSHTAIRSAQSPRDLRSPDSFASSLPRTSCGNESEASVSLSTYSKISKSRNPLKMLFPSEPTTTRHASEDTLQKKDDGLRSLSSSADKEKDRDMRFSAFVHLSRFSTDLDRKDSDARTLSSMSPSHRTDLNENLIPSRRSSLRSGPRRSPRGSKDLKSLNIDQELIEENHETVQRIRELQQAKEKRQNEWRKEVKRSERASKRSSLRQSSPTSLPRTGNVRTTSHTKVVEAKAAEETSTLSARVDGNDLSLMPALVNVADSEPLTPIERPLRNESFDVDTRRNYLVTPSTTHSSSPRTHRKRLSDSIKRASSIRHQFPNDNKGITDEVEAFLGAPRLTQKIRHPRTGRTIAFSEVGDPKGFVVFCCVGMGLTRYVTSFYDDIAKAQKLRIITPDRPGVGETDPMPAERSTPLSWVDDVAVICSSLGVEKFSLLAHSAGAIYALATALKMPQYVRGRIHLLGPWIPPSQLGSSSSGNLKPVNLPTSHKILSFLPTSFMKAANSRFLSATSASIEPKSRKEKKMDFSEMDLLSEEPSLSKVDFVQSRDYMLSSPETTTMRLTSQNLSAYQAECQRSSGPPISSVPPLRSSTLSPPPTGTRTPSQAGALTPQARERLYNTALTHRTWALATLNANPAVDLITCLERRRPIGFRYTDVTRAVVIHHGANDSRVPLENVRWLSSVMKRCELRVLENESHGLMASATVMSNVLGEMGKEWEEWDRVAREREQVLKEEEDREKEASKEREKGVRRGYPRW